MLTETAALLGQLTTSLGALDGIASPTIRRLFFADGTVLAALNDYQDFVLPLNREASRVVSMLQAIASSDVDAIELRQIGDNRLEIISVGPASSGPSDAAKGSQPERDS